MRNDPDPEPHRQHSTSLYSYLLDLDPDIADVFDPRMRMVARQSATVMVFDVPIGAVDFTPWFTTRPAGPGLLIVDGLIAVDCDVGDRTATELLGAGDLLQPWERGEERLLEGNASWRALVPARIAVLDAAFAERVRPWPQITHALFRRAHKRACNLSVQRAITSHPRLEVRLALLLWHLAERWGRVEPGGVRLSLPLTHSLLGRLISAERPSVSHALARLSEAGLVTGGAADWHIHGSPDQHLAHLAEHHLEREPPSLDDRRSGRG